MKRSDFINIGDKINIKKSDIVYYEQAENSVLRIGTVSGAEFFCVGTLEEIEALLFGDKSERCDGWIEVLQWAKYESPASIEAAITRLENGGDL